MRNGILSIGCLCLLLVTGTVLHASRQASPRPEVQENVHRLRETNSCPGCDLAGAILYREKFAGANLEGANLAGANFNLADLSGANLKNANLQGASFGGADLADADLTGANLTGAIIEGAYLAGAIMDGQVVVRRSYAEEEGPAVEEKVFEDAEGKSKNLPFTNQPMVDEEKEPQTMSAAPAAEEMKPAMKPESAPSAAEKEPQAASMPQDPMPTESKQLNAMGDAVVKEEGESPEKQSAPEPREMVRETPAPMAAGEEKKEVVAAVEKPEMASAEPRPEQAAAEPVAAMAEQPGEAAGSMEDPGAKKKMLVEKLLDDNRCVGCDLSGADLSGRGLEEADLERAVLRGANLRGADLEEANLKGADLRDADLRDADLREADMYRADISGADLTGARLEGALIDSMISTGAVGADFEGAIGNQ